jgi:hypothetical protein
MKMNSRKSTLSTILVAAFLLAIVSQGISFVSAQNDVAKVIVMPTTGGTTDPAPGEYTYSNGTNIVLTAIPDNGYKFSYWVITGDLLPGHAASQSQPGQFVDPQTGEVTTFPAKITVSPADSLTFQTNPTNITCGYGYSYTYTAFFEPVSLPSPTPGSNDAVVIVMPTNGGTVNPAAGRYTYPSGTIINISATPNSGYVFKYWIISSDVLPGHTANQGSTIADDNGTIIATIPKVSTSTIDSTTFTANPAHITCGYGYTYTYTALFAPQASATESPTPTLSPSPTVPEFSPTAIIAALAIAIVAVAVIYRQKTNKV